MADRNSKRFAAAPGLSRRAVLGGGAAAGAAVLVPLQPAWSAPVSAFKDVTPKPGEAPLRGYSQAPTPIWGFDGHVPGPALRVKQGETLKVRLKNGLAHPTTIHWHGIRIDNAYDGVPGLTQKLVAPGASFDYAFACPDAGTFWYHPHKMSSEQIGRGLYGPLIVEEREPPKVDLDQVLMLDDWRLTDDGEIHAQSFGAIHDRAHAGRVGNTLTVNGQERFDIAVRSGARLRLRLINAANANIFAVRIADHKPTIIAIDGQPVTPQAATDGLVLLGPGQRADLIVDAMGDPGSKAAITVMTNRDQLTMGEIIYTAEAPLRTSPSDAPIALKANPLPTKLDLASAVDIDLPMEGGAMGRMSTAKVGEQSMSLRELVREHGYAWALAGHAGMPQKPLFTVKRGQTVRIALRNRSAWPHAMHLHGSHFREVGDNASETWWRDTILMFREQDKTIAFVADNPGKWMLHCHMLEHHEGGMGTWFEVEA